MMPYTDQQIETLKATDPAIVKQAFAKMSETDRAELFAAVEDYNKRMATPKAEGGLSRMDEATTPQTPTPQPKKPGILERVAYSTPVQAVTDVPYSFAQMALMGPDRIGGIPLTGIEGIMPGAREKLRQIVQNQINQREARYKALPENQNLLGDLNRGIISTVTGGKALPAMNAPGSSMMAQGAAGAMAQPVTGAVEDVAKGKLLQGTVGAATAGLFKGASWISGKAASALAGTRLGNRLGIKTTLNPKYEGAPELSRQLDEAGIEHTVGDITSDPKVLSYEAAMARKDPRMMDLRVRQNQQALKHAERVVADLKAAVDAEGWKGIDDLTAAVEAGGKRAREAETLLTAIKNSGDDWQKIAKSSGNLKLLVNKLKADELYDTAEAIARQYGPVKVDKLSGSIKANIRNIGNTLGADDSITPYLQKMQAGIEEGKGLDFASLRETRSILNRKISGLNNPNAAVQDADGARTALKNVVKALEDDLDKYAKSHSSGLRNAWKNATEYYKNNVVPYKDKELGKVLADEDPAALGRLFAGKDTFEQRKMFNAIGEKGQKAIQWGLIEDAIKAGDKTQRGAMAPTFSAAKAASKLESLLNRGTHAVAFGSKRDKWAANGLARILRTIDKSDTIAWIPPTGESVERLGSDAMKGQLTTLGVGEKAINWLSKERLFKLYTNPKGRALLMRASDLEPGSKEMNSLIARAIGATSSDNETESEE